MAEAFHSVALNDALMPVISNVDAQPHRKAIEIRRRLVRQVSEPVIWTRCVATLLQAGCDRFLECGPGKVLSGLMKRIDKSVRLLTAGSNRYSAIGLRREPMNQTDRKVALVTGASRGIGSAIATSLAQRGFVVVGTATCEQGAASISAHLSEWGGVGRVAQCHRPRIDCGLPGSCPH